MQLCMHRGKETKPREKATDWASLDGEIECDIWFSVAYCLPTFSNVSGTLLTFVMIHTSENLLINLSLIN